MICSGFMLGIHFCTWIWSLDHTSLAHSLLFVSTHPIFLVLFHLIMRKPVSKFESIGVFFGFVGAVIILFDVDDEGEVSLIGM